MEGRGRAFSRNKKPRETFIGEDSTGAEYWLVPYDEAKVGNRKFVIKKSQKQVPAMLQGMITDAATGTRLFNKWIEHTKAKKKPTAKKDADKA